ncbi:phosphatase PAP2 family protein [Micromonospora musae]|uniref:Phosphatase PAP2 family protein n=1 Tax=Micromonospora musae TaxID=1894970 RepID=A0A3A9Y0V0_9ACTN|nr:phosphatase PAP2 family protein [Micromonospora musae]RKN17134.1 phosphatase PAP2 family protein [Micromonospora musae]RKN31065.1 phosphatase PAP2 family protein [Micromonospora musae]
MRNTAGVREPVRLRPVRPAGWWYDVLLLAALVGLTVALTAHHLFDVDRAVADWAQAHRPPVAYWVARVLNLLGQGTPLTLIAAGLGVLLAVRTRSIRPVLPAVVAFVLTYLTIGPLKVWTARPAPSASIKEPFLSPEQTLPLFQEHLPVRFAQSYPSGHVANAIVWYGVLALLLAPLLRSYGRTVPPRLVLAIRVLPPLIVLSTTTYLGWHWLTDSVAGLLLGLFLDRLLHRVPWDDVPLPGRPLWSERTRLFTSGP